ncbi:MAG: hypothetical protein ABI645_13465 [Pseudomonadota bacterium]
MNRSIVFLLVVIIAAAGGYYLYDKTRPDTQTVLVPAPDLAPPGANLIDGLGSYRLRAVGDNPELQKWFDQGLMLAYGFNHEAAERSFLKATELDPQCAMCWWGAALVLGPHVNASMDPNNNAKAWDRAQKAMTLAKNASAADQAYIQALTARYAQSPPQDRAPLDQAYAEAMGEVVRQFPEDLDAATLHAEALMDLQPWNYWDARQQPKGNILKIVSQLESVLARNADHPGALHLYIHAVEASSAPQRGADAADRLRALVPGSGHLVHMPSHIYTRVGRYNDAVLANQKAIAADDAYLAICRPAPGNYPLGYVPHNHHFLWWASSMQGASVMALAAAEETAKRTWLPELMRLPEMIFLQDYWITPLKAKVQFARWDELLATPAPPADMEYPSAMWHFAQGMARAHTGEAQKAQQHLEQLAKVAADPKFEQMLIGPQHPLSATLRISERVLAGTIAKSAKNYPAAIKALQEGVKLEDAVAYYEPPLWHEPVRVRLGAVLLAARMPAAAEAVFKEDLMRNPENGYALYGLQQSLVAMNRQGEARKVGERFKRAWAHADINLAAKEQTHHPRMTNQVMRR